MRRFVNGYDAWGHMLAREQALEDMRIMEMIGAHERFIAAAIARHEAEHHRREKRARFRHPDHF